MGVTIRDVARRAGVSVSTASAALNNKPFVSPQTRARVLQAALELNYHVNRTARNLAVGRTYQLGLLIPARLEHTFSASDFFNHLVRGIYDACGEAGYTLALFAVEGEQALVEQIQRWVYSHFVDGFLITHPTWEMPYLDILDNHHVPYVFVGRPPQADMPHVDNDNVQVAFDATEALIRAGHERILFINGPARYTYTWDRAEGYRRALAAHGLPQDDRLLVEAELTFADGYRVIDRLCGQVPFTGVVVLNPMQAMGVMQALLKHGCPVPDAVSVVTTDCEMVACMYPPLTAVNLKPYALGYHAARILLQRLNGEAVRPYTIPHVLMVRESVKPRR